LDFLTVLFFLAAKAREETRRKRKNTHSKNFLDFDENSHEDTKTQSYTKGFIKNKSFVPLCLCGHFFIFCQKVARFYDTVTVFLWEIAKKQPETTKEQRKATNEQRRMTNEQREITKEQQRMTKEQRGMAKEQRRTTKEQRGITKEQRNEKK